MSRFEYDASACILINMAKIKINALTILQNSKPITDLNRQDTSIYGTYIFF